MRVRGVWNLIFSCQLKGAHDCVQIRSQGAITASWWALWADLPPGQLLAPEWTASKRGMQWWRWSVGLLFGSQMFLRADQIPRVVKHVQVPGVNHCSIISGSFIHWMVKLRPQSRDSYRLAGYLPRVDLHLSHPQPWPVSLLVKSISTTWCSLADVFMLIRSSDVPPLSRMRPWAVDLSSCGSHQLLHSPTRPLGWVSDLFLFTWSSV